MDLDIKKYKITDNSFNIKDFKTDDTFSIKNKEDALFDMEKNIEKIAKLQDKLYAENKSSLVLIIQAMDAAGKDGTIKHVLSGVNPAGTHVVSFKQPNSTELDHDYLWRIACNLPERGMIGIFNRSHYEDVIVVRVHDLIKYSQMPDRLLNKNIWEDRFKQIKNFETYLYENGITPVKIFLNVSKKEQKERLLARIEEEDKNWKFNLGDVKERAYFDKYMECFSDAINNTATNVAPWYIVPADNKWFARYLVSEILVKELEKIDPKYPTLTDSKLEELKEGKALLMAEDVNSSNNSHSSFESFEDTQNDEKDLASNSNFDNNNNNKVKNDKDKRNRNKEKEKQKSKDKNKKDKNKSKTKKDGKKDKE